MRIRILGSAAGGGLPQWNCNCGNCRAARKTGAFFSQSSAAVSDDGRQWLLLNASPDLVYQFASFPSLAPYGKKLRGSPMTAVILTDGEMDHTAGLLSLREEKLLHLVSTAAVKDLLSRDFPLLPVLQKYCRIHYSDFPVRIAGILVTALELETDKAPKYGSHSPAKGTVVALKLSVRGKRARTCVYLPALPAITEKLTAWVADCDCLIVDGTFWSEREMISLGFSKRTASDMGHVPISGEGGSLEWLRRLDVPHKIYTHINNSNPILRKGSRERRMIEDAGVQISCDGMDIRL